METNNIHPSFTSSINSKANNYFNSLKNSKYASQLFAIKAILLLCIYIAAYIYFIFYSNGVTGMLLSCTLLGLCHVFIPVNISHDAIHGAVSKHDWVNKLCLFGFEITGTNSYMYKKKHLEAHRDKENGSKTKGIETQALLMQKKGGAKTSNMPWISYLCYSQYMIFFREFDLFVKEGLQFSKAFIKLLCWKGLYVITFLVIPFVFINASWWIIALCLLHMYLIVTMALVIILLMPTEKMEHSKLVDNNANELWAAEILAHNVDFSPGSRILNLVAGGANLNVVHYLFPTVNHVHYNRLARIIEETAAEYGLLYRKQVVSGVFGIHFRYLKNIQHANG